MSTIQIKPVGKRPNTVAGLIAKRDELANGRDLLG